MPPPITYFIGCAIIIVLMAWKAKLVIAKWKEVEADYQAKREHESTMRMLEEKMKEMAIIDEQNWGMKEAQERARIEADWERIWPTVEVKLWAMASPHVQSLVAKGISSVGVYEAVLNNINWDLLLESAIPAVPPSGQRQINQLIQQMIDEEHRIQAEELARERAAMEDAQ